MIQMIFKIYLQLVFFINYKWKVSVNLLLSIKLNLNITLIFLFSYMSLISPRAPALGYGIATPMGSPWRDKISLAILELQEKGEIQMLYDKWWKNTGETCTRNEKGKESKANSLGVDNIGGVFVVLLCGLAFAVIIAIFEFCYNSKKNALTEKVWARCVFFTHIVNEI